MWNIESMKNFRETQSLKELNEEDLKEVVEILNDMKKDINKIQTLTIEPFFEFLPTMER